jgi:hypothetical protein
MRRVWASSLAVAGAASLLLGIQWLAEARSVLHEIEALLALGTGIVTTGIATVSFGVEAIRAELAASQRAAVPPRTTDVTLPRREGAGPVP